MDAILFNMFRDERNAVPVESVGQAAAGGLLLSVAIVELVLAFWAAGWLHRAGALAVAGAGLVFLTCGTAQIMIAARTSSRSRESNGLD